jgi:hypothetical protein
VSDRCGRPNRTSGKPCTSYRTRSGDTCLPACKNHLTVEEQAQLNELNKAAQEQHTWARDVGWPPACWSWPITEADRDMVARDSSIGLLRWQADRCGICGSPWGHLVTDHDHYTTLIRGELCRGCNIAEAVNPAAVFRYWRERPAAALFGLAERYLDPATGEYARPKPRYNEASRWASPASGQLGL